MSLTKIAGALAVAGAVTIAAGLQSQAATLDDVRADDRLRCGINPGLPGFSHTDDRGRWSGFEAAYCRAVAAAVLGDAEKISFVNREDAIPGLGLRRSRHPVAQHHMDLLARCRPDLHRH